MNELNEDLKVKHQIRNWLSKYITESGYLIETGTHGGWGVESALAYGFKKVVSIEITDNWFYKAQDYFKKEILSNKVFLWKGESERLLPDILKLLYNHQLTFWLDAHFPGERSLILGELEAIKNHPIKNHVILIDDQWDYVNGLYGGIRIKEVKDKILEINPDYKFSFEDTGIKENVLVAKV